MSNKIFNAVSDAINRAEWGFESSALCFPLITPPAFVTERFSLLSSTVQHKCQKFTFSDAGNVIVSGADNKDRRGDELHTNVIRSWHLHSSFLSIVFFPSFLQRHLKAKHDHSEKAHGRTFPLFPLPFFWLFLSSFLGTFFNL